MINDSYAQPIATRQLCMLLCFDTHVIFCLKINLYLDIGNKTQMQNYDLQTTYFET